MVSQPLSDADVAYRHQRARFLRHLVDDGRCDRATADRMISRWEREAGRNHRSRGSSSYWKDAWLWIAEDRAATGAATKHDMGAAADGQVYGG